MELDKAIRSVEAATVEVSKARDLACERGKEVRNVTEQLSTAREDVAKANDKVVRLSQEMTAYQKDAAARHQFVLDVNRLGVFLFVGILVSGMVAATGWALLHTSLTAGETIGHLLLVMALSLCSATMVCTGVLLPAVYSGLAHSMLNGLSHTLLMAFHAFSSGLSRGLEKHGV